MRPRLATAFHPRLASHLCPPRLRELTTSYPSFVRNSVASVGDLATLDSRKNSADVMSSSGSSLVAPVR